MTSNISSFPSVGTATAYGILTAAQHSAAKTARAVSEHWAFGQQFRQLNALREQAPDRAADWNAREKALRQHIAGLSARQVRQAAAQEWLGWLNLPRRTLMENLIHVTPQAKVSANQQLLQRCVREGVVERQVIWSQHAQLEALLVRGASRQRQPTLILSTPNSVQAEDLLGTPSGPLQHSRPLVQIIAQELGVNVLLYNGRGIGASLGREWSTQQGVEDAEAVLLHALQLSDAPPAAIGISIGAGYLARGVRALQDKAALGPEGIGLFSSYHSFTSIIGAAVGGYGGACFAVLQGVAALLRMDSLDVFAALRKAPLAQTTVVARPCIENQLSGDGQALPPINALYRPEIRCVDEVGRAMATSPASEITPPIIACCASGQRWWAVPSSRQTPLS